MGSWIVSFTKRLDLICASRGSLRRLNSSAANTFETDWAALEYNQEPNHVKIDQYLSRTIPKEEWEDEVVNEVMQRRIGSTIIPKTLWKPLRQ